MILPSLILFSNWRCISEAPSLISLSSESEGDPLILKGLPHSAGESFFADPAESSEQVLAL